MADEINPEVKQYVEGYGFENWTSQPSDNEKEYEVNAEKVKRTVKAIKNLQAAKKRRDVTNYNLMAANLPKRPLSEAYKNND